MKILFTGASSFTGFWFAKTLAAAPRTGASEAIVGLSLLGVPHDGVGLADLLEPFLGRRVAGILVRVVEVGELPVGFLDLLGAGVR